MSNHDLWMWVSGATGFSCFVIIHFTKLLKNHLYAAMLQWTSNLFVFVIWGSAFLERQGFAKVIAFGGVVVPVIMATITIRKVLRTRHQT